MACSPGKQFNVRFPAGMDRLSGAEAGSLGAWVSTLQRDYPNHAMLLLVGYIEEEGENKEIVERRAAWVKNFLIDMGEDPADIVWGGTSVYRAENIGSYSSTTPSTIAIEFLPACPHECCKR
jgi:hypothetical protein